MEKLRQFSATKPGSHGYEFTQPKEGLLSTKYILDTVLRISHILAHLIIASTLEQALLVLFPLSSYLGTQMTRHLTIQVVSGRAGIRMRAGWHQPIESSM